MCSLYLISVLLQRSHEYASKSYHQKEREREEVLHGEKSNMANVTDVNARVPTSLNPGIGFRTEIQCFTAKKGINIEIAHLDKISLIINY